MPFDSTNEAPATLSDIGLIYIGAQRVERWKARFPSTTWVSTTRLPLNRFADLYPSAPRDVRKLVHLISQLPDAAHFVVEYISGDPILYVYIGRRRRCVAIWHRGAVRAIAHGARLSRTQRAIRCLVRTV